MTMTTATTVGGTKGGVLLSGAVRDVYSREILFNAQPNLVFAQFADRRTELGQQPGDTIRFTKYADLHGSSRLSEVENIGVTHLSASMVHIQVDEHGFGISESEKLIRMAWDDVMTRATRLLGQHYGRTVDGLVRDQYRSAGSLSTIYVGGGANRAAITDVDTFDVQNVKNGAEALAIEKAMRRDGAFFCVVHPHVARGLRDDSEWIEAHKYTQPGVNNIYRGEIGMIEGVRFIESTFTTVIQTVTGAVLADRVDTGEVQAVANATLDIYQSPMFGDNVVGWAEGLPVEIRDNGVIDFGRTRELAWYSIMGAGQIRPENCVMIESA